ncbi:MAG: serine/threonine protein kinase [Candidatus Brocadiae bacterium]|nr:serine/threonine protein kinase [Candidatus Brocadiia bacterium]
MKIITKQSHCSLDLDKVTPMAQGGEGEIYPIDNKSVAKVYYSDQITRERQEKILALCAKYDFYKGLFKEDSFAFPRESAANVDTNELVGFAMQYLGKFPHLTEICFDLGQNQYKKMQNQQLDNSRALDLVYRLFQSLEVFHQTHIILGDINPSNILYNFATKNPLFIDLDTVHIEKYGCLAFSEDYLDPQVEAQGKTVDGLLKYTSSGDQFGMAVLAYEIFVGANPFYLRCSPNLGTVENKRQAISLLGEHHKQSYLADKGIKILEDPTNALILKRLDLLKTLDGRLYQYLYDVFIKEKRCNLLTRLPKSDVRNPGYSFYNANSSVRTIMDMIKDGWTEQKKAETPLFPGNFFSKGEWDTIYQELSSIQALKLKGSSRYQDPEAFQKFVENFGISYQKLLLGEQ